MLLVSSKEDWRASPAVTQTGSFLCCLLFLLCVHAGCADKGIESCEENLGMGLKNGNQSGKNKLGMGSSLHSGVLQTFVFVGLNVQSVHLFFHYFFIIKFFGIL